MIGVWRQILYRLDVAAKLVRHDNARLTKLLDQPGEETPGSLGVTASLNQDVENIAVSINCPPEPEFLAADRDDGLIHIEDRRGRIVGIEIKAAATVSGADFSGLRILAEASGERFVSGFVLYDHQKVIPFGERLHAVPIAALWR